MGRKILITKGRPHFPKQEYFIKDDSKDFHLKYGIIKSEDMKKEECKVKTSMNKEYCMFSPKTIDLYKRIKRLPQIIPLKDIGAIIAYTGINRDSVILDAGAGSGGLSCFLALVAKKVITYEIKDENIEAVKENIKYLDLKNITIKKGDISEAKEKDMDVITLDVPEPWIALKTKESLKTGGFIVSYSPTIPQVQDFVNELENHEDLLHLKTIELIEREWQVEERKVRPQPAAVGHSGFITFVRKIC